MVHCPKCGAALSPDARFCGKCGQTQPATAWQPALAQSGFSENAAATLSYVLGWLTGIIFYLVDHRPYVRFHAAQSIVTFGGLHVIRTVLGAVLGIGWFYHGFGGFYPGRHWGSFGAGIAVLSMLGFITFILWIVCMVKAYQGQRFMVPIAGDIAANLAGQ